MSRRLQDESPAWAATMAFYAALHDVEAYFDVEGRTSGLPRHYNTHAQRTPAVRRRLQPVYPHYRYLYDRSIEARYECITVTPSEVEDLHRHWLEPLRNHIMSYIRAAGARP